MPAEDSIHLLASGKCRYTTPAARAYQPEADIPEVQQFQHQQIQQPECQVQEMDENLDMRLKRKTTECWTTKKKSERLNAMNQEKVNTR